MGMIQSVRLQAQDFNGNSWYSLSGFVYKHDQRIHWRIRRHAAGARSGQGRIWVLVKGGVAGLDLRWAQRGAAQQLSDPGGNFEKFKFLEAIFNAFSQKSPFCH